jgi:tetratricopeptide (TPR) repeat protein
MDIRTATMPGTARFAIGCLLFWLASAEAAFVSKPTFRADMSSPAKASSTELFGDLRTSRQYIAEGMQAFREGQVEQSIKLFDQAEAAEPRMDPYLWQRGLSYYYANDFDKASQQFRRDVSANPLDVEEIVWDIASQLRMSPSEFPVPQAMSLPPLQKDRRPIMAAVYQLYRGTATEEALAKAGHASGAPSDEFYSLLYLGLFAEARGEPSKAEHYLRQATHTPYATSSGRADYMVTISRVHCQLRGWEP